MTSMNLKRSRVELFPYKKDFQTSLGYLYPQDLNLCHNLRRGHFSHRDLRLYLMNDLEAKMEVMKIFEVM